MLHLSSAGQLRVGDMGVRSADGGRDLHAVRLYAARSSTALGEVQLQHRYCRGSQSSMCICSLAFSRIIIKMLNIQYLPCYS